MKRVRLLPSKKDIPVEEGETILSALERAGYALPNNCRAGACGECKARVCHGDFDQGFILDMALPQAERDKGYALMCMARPTSEVVEIEYGTKNALPKLFAPQEGRPHMVVEKTPATASIVKLRLRSLEEPLRFWPGQYIKLDNGQAPPRCYSIANIPNQEGELLLFITRIKGGKLSGQIHDQLKIGERLHVSGPYGTFIGDPGAETPVLCLAAGSGLAPIRSLASAALLRGGFRHPAEILFSAKTVDDLIDPGHFAFLQAKFDNFKFTSTLTRKKAAGFLNGRIPTLLAKRYTNLADYSVYIAGGPSFVADCVAKARQLGAAETRIHQESFHDQNV